MNGHKNSRATTRSYRTMKVAPTTRAIRAALAVSATMLALAGSGAALAGTCAVTGLSEVTCNGVFTDDVANTVPVINLVPDLTLIVGADGTTTVDPASGVSGITSTWGGDATVITYADINTYGGADGIYMDSDYTATLSNYGSVYTYVDNGSANAIFVEGTNAATVVNGGDITAAAASGTGYNAVGLYVNTDAGTVDIDNLADGTISASSYNGVAIGIDVGYGGAVTNINNDGVIQVSSFNGQATGIEVFTLVGDVTVTNGGDIEAYSLTGNTTGIDVYSLVGNVSASNTGTIDVGGQGYAEGIAAVSLLGTATVDNSGTLTVTSYGSNASGVNAYGKYADVTNSGDITVSGYSNAAGIQAIGVYGATIDNSGSITVSASAFGGQASGIAVDGGGSININNSGDISVTSYGDGGGALLPYSEGADGVGISGISTYSGGEQPPTLLYGANDVNVVNSGTDYVNVAGNGTGMYGATFGAGSVYMDNSGTVTVYAGGIASGIVAFTDYGTIEVQNSGDVTVSAFSGAAYGVNASSTSYEGDITVNSSGSISAYSTSDTSVGVVARTTGEYADVSIDNSGSISSYSYDGSGVGVEAVATGYDADVSVTSSGSIYAGSYNGSAFGIYAISIGDYGDASVVLTDTGSLDVYSYGGNATGIVAVPGKYYGDATINNAGTITVSSYNGTAIGFEEIAAGEYGDAYFYNSGSITVTSTNDQAVGGVIATNLYESDITFDNSGSLEVNGYTAAVGVEAVAKYSEGQIDFTNSGSIDVYSVNDIAVGAIIGTAGYDGDITVDNSGSLYAGVVDGTAAGFSVQTTGDYADVDFSNSGSVTTYAYFGSTGIGVTVGGYQSNISIDNSGSVTSTSVFDDATGILARNETDSGAISVDSSGSVSVYAYGVAIGINAIGSGYGDTTVNNSGSIYAYSSDDEATGIYAYAYYANVAVDNSGSIDAESDLEAYGIDAYTYGDGNIDIVSSGDIIANSFADQAEGINAVANGSGDISVDNSGSITVYGYTGASGVYAFAPYGDVSIINSDAVSVSSPTSATGLDAQAPYGSAYVHNTDTGSVSVDSGYVGVGIRADAKYSAYILNDGDVTVSSSNDYGNSVAIGGYSHASGTGANKYNTYATVVNNGSVNAYANSPDFLAEAIGVSAVADDNGVYNYAYADVVNTGSVNAAATGFVAISIGLDVSSDYVGSIEQYGSAYAYSNGYQAAIATGARVSADWSASFYGAEGSSTSAYATSYYTAFAEGAAVFGNEYANFYNAGDISASAVSSGDFYTAIAHGVTVIGDYVSFDNAGAIDAYASGYNATAIGAYVRGYYGHNVYNSGDISAEAVGSNSGVAIGVYATSNLGDVDVFNSGTIYATGNDFATGVEIRSGTNAYVYNTGTIEASGAAYNIAIYTPGLGVATILNYGTITGAIWTGDTGDYLYNADGAEWNPGQTPTYFAGGDDTILNYGTINMDDSVIGLGTWTYYGNHFYNYGTINVSGADNVIDMGGPQALVPSANPYAFYNYGVIDFQDGAPDDVLTIIGDFAGDGDINVDVSGLDGVSDVLYIDGSVVSGTAGVINVDLLDLPNSISALIPIVYVTGDSVDGNFVLGDVNWDEDNTFVTLDFGIVSDIDATNATNDVFSLGIEVTGLSDPGTLAASLGSSVQSLMNSQVGTWRQRMGVIDGFNKGGVALWARVFTDKGSFTPEHVAGNFGQGGNFDFDQKNSGVEGGVDFAVTDEFSLGLLVSKSKAETHLDDPGTGHADIDADTWGVYGTWISPNGFYLDASYRWMNFDVDLSSVAGGMKTSGDAEAFNVEMGYAWTLEGGLKIEPQLQYTRTSVNNFDVLTTSTGMNFEEDGGDSSRGRLGVSIRKGFGEADNGWLWTPYATLSAVREFNGKSAYAINNTFFGETSVEGTSALLELGFTARHQNWAIYGGLNWQDGGAVNSFFGGQLGVRYTFGGPAPAPAPVAPPPAKTCADLDDDGDGINNCDDKCLGSSAGEAVGPDGCPVPAPEPVMEPKPFRG